MDHGDDMEFPFEGASPPPSSFWGNLSDKTLTQTGRGSGYRKNKHELRKLLLEEVELFNHADQQYQEDAEEERMGRGGAIPPPSPR